MTTNTKVAELPKRWRTVKNGLSATGCANELDNALARQEADKTKAAIWIEFAENGNIRFWTSDQDRAIEESFCHARSLTAYYTAPPAAQAVDLEQVRKLLVLINSDLLGDDYLNLSAEALALIDQQAGKGGA